MFLTVSKMSAQDISGTILDKETKEPLIGAMITIDGTNLKAVSDLNGNFKISRQDNKPCELVISYVGYKNRKIKVEGNNTFAGGPTIYLAPDEHQLSEVSVTAVQQTNTQTATILEAKKSAVALSNVSAQEIKKTQDSNAGEVIRRVPGVSLIDDKFVMVRGLSQRYNNVWVNGGAVPSSEADARSFSFDIIPSSQIDNLTIVKVPTSEYPADYSGGFIIINTKEIPTENSVEVSVGGNWNDATVMKNFAYAKGSGTDFMGFDSGLRTLNGGINAPLHRIAQDGTDLQNNHLNNDWLLKNKKPWGDLKLGATLNHHWNIKGHKLGLITALNYTSEYRSYEDMENNLFGVYDTQNKHSNYLRHSVDNQYNHNVRLGAMVNTTFLTKNGNHKFQLKNIFNQLGNDRYTWREGISAQADGEKSAEYYYRSRSTYNGQLTGKHTFTKDMLDWNLGYAYANRHMPDRRRYLIDDALESGVMALSTGNNISREWTQLDEHILSASVNDKREFSMGNAQLSVKAGVYGEYRTRTYTTRDFIYNWNVSNNHMPAGFRQMDIPTLLSDVNNMGEDKLYMLEQMQMRNNYRGHNHLGAGYLSGMLSIKKLSVLAGIRYEHNDMELISNTKDTEVSEMGRHYRNNDIFPSVNTLYKFNDAHQLRLSYGRSVNRPEFREISSSVYYDFDLASNVQGNTELENCYVDNIDLRYEFYPSRGEIISLAAFYKHFDSPIEWTYTVSGGTDLTYSYMNAKSANTYGLELDVRKDLTFIGLPGFSWSLNGALIKSEVKFDKGTKEQDRPMQGQSPYLINTGLFYRNEPAQIEVAVLYNRIGKRIIGVGRSEGTTENNESAKIPDSYEMPRNMIDITASKKIGKHWELKMNIRDLLAEKVYYKQFATAPSGDKDHQIEEITRSFKPGRNIGLNVTYKF